MNFDNKWYNAEDFALLERLSNDYIYLLIPEDRALVDFTQIARTSVNVNADIFDHPVFNFA